MPELVPQLYADFREKVIAAWPEVSANGVYGAAHVNMIPWADLELPYAVLHCERFEKEPGWAADTDMWAVAFHVYYVYEPGSQTVAGPLAEGPISPLIERLETLRDVFLTRATMGLTNGQVLGVQEFSWDDSLPPNAVLSAKGDRARAGRVTVSILIGLTVS